jgi:hypothetical protein
VLAKERLTTEQQRQVEQFCQASEELARAYMLSQNFAEILRERKAEALKEWLRCARASQIAELQGLAKSMRASIIQRFMPPVPSLGAKVKSKGK